MLFTELLKGEITTGKYATPIHQFADSPVISDDEFEHVKPIN